MHYQKPNLFFYRVTQFAAWFFAANVFKRKILRNELKGVKGPFVVIANHQAAYDFVNLIGISRRPMSFVVSNSFYQSLPIQGIMDRIGVIPKQQFQTNASDLKKMRAVIQAGQPVVIYPAGLMCEDGLSTPIPAATGKLLKWLGVDVYMAKTQGTYFAMPKWTSGFRPGKTTLDVYKLFTKEEVETLDLEEIRRRTEEALLFDAYREQEQLLVSYKNAEDLQGIENVLYICPHCGAEFSIAVKDKSTVVCKACGYSHTGDKYGFLHKTSSHGQEIRYISDWSKKIYQQVKEKLAKGEQSVLSAATAFHMVDPKKKKYVPVGAGTVTLSPDKFLLEGTIRGEKVSVSVPTGYFPTLPFSPGKYIEVQDGSAIYRCVLEEGRLAMKFINMVKAFYELRQR